MKRELKEFEIFFKRRLGNNTKVNIINIYFNNKKPYSSYTIGDYKVKVHSPIDWKEYVSQEKKDMFCIFKVLI